MITFDPEVIEVDEPSTFYWRITQPVGTKDVDLDLGTMISEWDDAEIDLVVWSIARKLQHIASQLLSAPRRAQEVPVS